MALGKSLGPDGIGVEFYRKYWSIIAKDLINDIHSCGNSTYEMKLGIITLIRKKRQKRS